MNTFETSEIKQQIMTYFNQENLRKKYPDLNFNIKQKMELEDIAKLIIIRDIFELKTLEENKNSNKEADIDLFNTLINIINNTNFISYLEGYILDYIRYYHKFTINTNFIKGYKELVYKQIIFSNIEDVLNNKNISIPYFEYGKWVEEIYNERKQVITDCISDYAANTVTITICKKEFKDNCLYLNLDFIDNSNSYSIINNIHIQGTGKTKYCDNRKEIFLQNSKNITLEFKDVNPMNIYKLCFNILPFKSDITIEKEILL